VLSGIRFLQNFFHTDILIIRKVFLMDEIRLQIAQRGVITLPKVLRDTYQLQPGDEMTLLDIGGVFVLSARRSQVDAMADKLSADLAAQGETLESILLALREARENYAG
jgi:bifunctional DNA-binding transcriptional regulator/antitoxin component of YhaV-PrlF toxin-antitoxin module